MRVCFVVDPPTQKMGGAQVQCELIGNGLMKKGWDVVYLTSADFSGKLPALQTLNSKAWVMKSHIEGLHALSIFWLLIRLSPDIVIIPYANWQSEIAAIYTLLYGRKLVFRAASILDADLTFGEGTGWNEFSLPAKLLHLLATRRADAIVTNALYVAEAFRKVLPGKKILTIRNGLEVEPAMKQEPSHVLWIGTFSSVKNPEVFVRLAEELPRIHFVMCGGGPLFAKMQGVSRGIRNLRLMGEIRGGRKRILLQKSFAVVNTSVAEGFPNTLIEAGLQGVPFVSFVDPDEVICRNHLGFHVRSFSELVKRTTQLVEDGNLREVLGRSIRSYVEIEHDIKETVFEYDRLLRSLLGQGLSQ